MFYDKIRKLTDQIVAAKSASAVRRAAQRLNRYVTNNAPTSSSQAFDIITGAIEQAAVCYYMKRLKPRSRSVPKWIQRERAMVRKVIAANKICEYGRGFVFTVEKIDDILWKKQFEGTHPSINEDAFEMACVPLKVHDPSKFNPRLSLVDLCRDVGLQVPVWIPKMLLPDVRERDFA